MTTHTHTADIHNTSSGSLRALLEKYRLMYKPSDSLGSRPRVPHPGDVLYWVGCASAVSALLFFALR